MLNLSPICWTLPENSERSFSATLSKIGSRRFRLLAHADRNSKLTVEFCAGSDADARREAGNMLKLPAGTVWGGPKLTEGGLGKLPKDSE